jgi:hypothetical protein
MCAVVTRNSAIAFAAAMYGECDATSGKYFFVTVSKLSDSAESKRFSARVSAGSRTQRELLPGADVDRCGKIYAQQEQRMAETDTNPAADATERMRAAGSAMTENGSQLGLTILSQAEANTQEAFRAMRAAAQANDLNDVMRIQSDYLRDQGARSMAQAREVGEMIAQFGRSAIGQMTGRG